MKAIIRLMFTLLLLQLSIAAFSSGDNTTDTLNAPKKALILSQSFEAKGIYFTVMDLENNEMVILFYGTNYSYGDFSYFRLRKVLRTGIILDPERQKQISIYDGNIRGEKE